MPMTFVVVVLTLCLAILFAWSFRVLPRERWQILAVLPRQREPDGTWRGTNLTWYGALNALATAVAFATVMFLTGSSGLPFGMTALILLAVLAVCIPASKIMNRIVEGHWQGFTIGGASFIGILIIPWIVLVFARLILPGDHVVPLMVFGALGPAYAIGEGIGRLACLSFGCCYGQRLTDCSPRLQALFSRGAAVFQGRLKKAAYAGNLEGERLVPIQALTAVVSSVAGLLGLALYLSGWPGLAYVISLVITQLWRFFSEFLRADYRGPGKITVYQRMALIGAIYTIMVWMFWPNVASFPAPDVMLGLAALWTPGAILLIETVGLLVFLRMGISTVTASRIVFDINK